MKLDHKNIGLIMAALVAITAGTAYAISSGIDLQSASLDNPIATTKILGHIQAVVYDKSGNIVAYRQADNAIVNTGLNVLAHQLFLADGLQNGGNHTNSTSGAFGWMNIGNQSAPAPAPGDTELACALISAGSGGAPCGSDRPLCAAQLSEINHKTAYNNGGFSRMNITAIATFDGAVCNSANIQEAGMWNNATTAAGGEMFARNTFGSVTLTTTDSLELTWRFTFTDQ
jgi:hypothetical protein